MRKLWGATGAGLGALAGAGAARATDLMGQPTPGGVGLQPAGSILKQQAITFHNWILMPIITAIALLILALLAICIVRFNKRANPTPARWSHNTPIEILWTALPVLILTFIAIFSFKLLFAYAAMPKPDLTVKATGYQWYWGYAYPDQKIDEYTSNYLPEADAKAAGEPYLLGVNNPMVVPVGKTVRVLVTGADVIHDFGVPAFGLKMDAVPGRVNATWFHADKIGVYYGQCDQLCGLNHAFMPIEIKVVSQPDFDAWVASKAPPPPAASSSAPAAPATPAAPAAAPAAAAPQHVAQNSSTAALR
jgi:cytochrome c oxidase subunit 2